MFTVEDGHDAQRCDAPLLDVQAATCGYGKTPVVENISLSFHAGEFFCLLGPNGCGKTTLFRTILGFLELFSGSIRLEGEDVRKLPLSRIARTIGYVPQSHTPPFPFPVRDVVAMGRTAHLGLFQAPGPRDFEISQGLLERLGIAHLGDRPYTEVSGGERQMVLVARALAQEPKLLVMDEPTSNLDFGNQIRVLECIKGLVGEGLGVVMTTHVPDHAFLCADRVALMKSGRLLALGSPEEVVTESALRHVYGIDVRVVEVNLDGKLVRTCLPRFSEFSENCPSFFSESLVSIGEVCR